MGQFREHLKRMNLSNDSISVYERIILRFNSEVNNSLSSHDKFVESFEQWLSDHAPKNASVHKAAAQAYCRYKFGSKIHFKKSKKQSSVKKQTSWITKVQYNELIEFVREISKGPLMYRNLAIINVFVFAGLKVAEVAALRITPDAYWIDLNQNCIWCDGDKVPLAVELRNSLLDWLSVRENFPGASQDSLFLSKRGKPMSVRLIQHTLESYYLPGIKITPEILRHTFAKWLLLNRYEEKVVRTLLRVDQSKYLEAPRRTVIPEILDFKEETEKDNGHSF